MTLTYNFDLKYSRKYKKSNRLLLIALSSDKKNIQEIITLFIWGFETIVIIRKVIK